jgi:hypothetical protein
VVLQRAVLPNFLSCLLLCCVCRCLPRLLGGCTPLEEARLAGHAECANALESDAADEREFKHKSKSKKFKVTEALRKSPTAPLDAPPSPPGATSAVAGAAATAAATAAAAAAAEEQAAEAKARRCGGVGWAHRVNLTVVLLEGCDTNARFLVRASCADALRVEVRGATCQCASPCADASTCRVLQGGPSDLRPAPPRGSARRRARGGRARAKRERTLSVRLSPRAHAQFVRCASSSCLRVR